MAEDIPVRITELNGLIKKARDDYHNGTSTIPDEVYDAWVDELSDLDSINEAITAIGAPPVSEWAKVRHDIQMGSLDKVNTREEMDDWLQT